MTSLLLIQIPQWRGVPSFQKECYRDGTLCDFTIVAKSIPHLKADAKGQENGLSVEDVFRDGDEHPEGGIPCHKLVVAARSLLLREYIQNKTTKDIKEMRLDHVSIEHVKLWTDAMYYGMLTAEVSDLRAMIAAARKLKLEENAIMALATSITEQRHSLRTALDHSVLIQLIHMLDSLIQEEDGELAAKFEKAAQAIAVDLAAFCAQQPERDELFNLGITAVAWKYIFQIFRMDFTALAEDDKFPFYIEDDGECQRTFTLKGKDDDSASNTTNGEVSKIDWSFSMARDDVVFDFATWSNSLPFEELSTVIANCWKHIKQMNVSFSSLMQTFEIFCKRPELNPAFLWFPLFYVTQQTVPETEPVRSRLSSSLSLTNNNNSSNVRKRTRSPSPENIPSSMLRRPASLAARRAVSQIFQIGTPKEKNNLSTIGSKTTPKEKKPARAFRGRGRPSR